MNYKKIIFGTLVFMFLLQAIPGIIYASETNGTILTGDTLGSAWSSNVGWMNFGLSTGDIHVTNTGLTGNAWNDDYGWINLAPMNGGVTNDGEGVLGGHAWGEKLDWINFSGVTIDKQGRFHGAANGSLIGTLSFDCASCDVRTDWRHISAQKVEISGGHIFTSATTEAPMPPSTSKEEQTPLFDVSSEPAQSAQQNTITLVVFLIIANILLILLVIFVARRAVAYFRSRVKIK